MWLGSPTGEPLWYKCRAMVTVVRCLSLVWDCFLSTPCLCTAPHNGFFCPCFLLACLLGSQGRSPTECEGENEVRISRDGKQAWETGRVWGVNKKKTLFKYRWCRQAREMPNRKFTTTQNIEEAESYNLVVKTTFEDWKGYNVLLVWFWEV